MSHNKNYGGFIMFERVKFEKLEDIRNNSKPIKGRKAEEYYYSSKNHKGKYRRGGRHSIRPEYNEYGVCDSYVYIYGLAKAEILRVYHNDIVQMMSVGQGRLIMNDLHEDRSWSVGHEKLRGGHILRRWCYKDETQRRIYPLINGMAFSIDSNEPVTKYDVHCRTINRKKAKESWVANYSKWSAVLSMMKSIDDEGKVGEMVREIHKSHGFKYHDNFHWIESRPYRPLTPEHIEAVKKASKVSVFDEVVTACGAYDIPDNKLYKSYLNEVDDNFNTKIHPCEDKYFPTNKHIKIVMREVNDE
jgi:hypothetical protein